MKLRNNNQDSPLKALGVRRSSFNSHLPEIERNHQRDTNPVLIVQERLENR